MIFKITYNIFDYTAETFLIGCKIIEAESYLDAQKKFNEKYSGVIRDIELLN